MVYAGTIMEIDKNKTYLMTMDLEMVTIKTKPDYFVGKSVSFTKKDRYFDINFTKMVSSPRILLIAAAMLIILTSAIMAIVLGPAKKTLISLIRFVQQLFQLISTQVWR